jgi:hypothetical protein
VFQKAGLFMTTAAVKSYNTEGTWEQGTERNLRDWKERESGEYFIMRSFTHISSV